MQQQTVPVNATTVKLYSSGHNSKNDEKFILAMRKKISAKEQIITIVVRKKPLVYCKTKEKATKRKFSQYLLGKKENNNYNKKRATDVDEILLHVPFIKELLLSRHPTDKHPTRQSKESYKEKDFSASGFLCWWIFHHHLMSCPFKKL
jgi:hypothetical protein